jgi:hypothetical protein|tara:strand:+ start:132 stop:263 length:132 start_codon:yes stop_codon:yes gene_type:complete
VSYFGGEPRRHDPITKGIFDPTDDVRCRLAITKAFFTILKGLN